MRKRFYFLLLTMVLFCLPTLYCQIFQDALMKARKEFKPQNAKSSAKKISASAAKKFQGIEDGALINIKTRNGKYVRIGSDGQVRASAEKCKEYETIRVCAVGNDRYAFFSVHGFYLTATISDNPQVLKAGAKLVKGWELFEIIPVGEYFALKAVNGCFVATEDNQTLVANRTSVDEWEKFKFEKAKVDAVKSGSFVSLKSPSSKLFFSVKPDRDYQVFADAKLQGVWERMQLQRSENGKVGFQLRNGKWLSCYAGKDKSQQGYIGTSDSQGLTENFELFDGVGDEVFLKAANGRFVQIVADNALKADSKEPVALLMQKLPDKDELPFTPVYSKFNLRCGYSNDFEQICSSKSFSARIEAAFYRPKLPDGWVFVGDVIGLGKEQPAFSVLIIEDDPTGKELQKPTGYNLIWSDKNKKVKFWQPIAPEGFAALGYVVTADGKDPVSVPSAADFRCVNKRHLVPGRATRPIWNDKNSEAPDPIALHLVARRKGDETSLLPGTFLSSNFNSDQIGGAGGGGHTDLAPDGYYLVGFTAWSDRFLRGLEPVYKSFSDEKQIVGGSYGQKDGKKTTMKADAGYAVGAVKGRAGDFIDHLITVFMKTSGFRCDATKTKDSAKAGGDGGGDFQISGNGCLFQGVDLRSGANIDAINLIPYPIDEAWLLAGKTSQEVYDETFSGFVEEYKRINHDRIVASAEQKLYENLRIPAAESFVFEEISDDEVPSPTEHKPFDDKLDGDLDGIVIDNGKSKFSDSSLNKIKKEIEKNIGKNSEFSTVWTVVESILKSVKLENPSVDFRDEKFFLLGDARIRLSEKLQFLLKLTVEIPIKNLKEDGVAISAIIPGQWKNPMGINGLTLQDMGFGGVVKTGPPLLFVEGKMNVGLKETLGMRGIFSADSPSGIAGIVGTSDELVWSDVLAIANSIFSPVKVQLDLKGVPDNLFAIKEARVMVAKTDDENLKLKKGSSVAGDLSILGQHIGKLEAFFSADGKIVGSGEFDQTQIGPLKVSRAPFSKEGPMLVIEHSKKQTRYEVTGFAEIAGSHLRFSQTLGAKTRLILAGNLAGVLPVSLAGEADIKKFWDVGKMKLAGEVSPSYLGLLQEKALAAVKLEGLTDLAAIAGYAILRIDRIKVSCGLEDLAAGKSPSLTFEGYIAGKKMTLDLGGIDLTKPDEIAEGIIKALVDEIGKYATTLAKFAEDVAKLMLEVGNAIGDECKAAASEVAKLAETAAAAAADETQKAAQQIYDFAADSGKKVVDAGAKLLSGAGSVGKAIFGGAKKLFSGW